MRLLLISIFMLIGIYSFASAEEGIDGFQGSYIYYEHDSDFSLPFMPDEDGEYLLKEPSGEVWRLTPDGEGGYVFKGVHNEELGWYMVPDNLGGYYVLYYNELREMLTPDGDGGYISRDKDGTLLGHFKPYE